MKRVFLYILLLVLIVFIPTQLVDIVNERNTDLVIRDEDMYVDIPDEDISPEEVEVPVVEKKTPPTTSSGNEWWEYPEDIKITSRSGDDLLVLVNKEYRLPSTYAPTDLVRANNSGIRRGDSYYLRNILITDLSNLVADAKSSGIDLSIVSGYRSYATQQSTYNYWLAKNNYNVGYVDTFSARAGHSQHQLGTAIDFSSSEINDALGDSFGNTKASEWLVENAYRYGFVISYPKGYELTTGYKYESWHYRYIGKSNALEVRNSGIILELYLRSKN